MTRVECTCKHDLNQHKFYGGTSPQDDWSIEECSICNCKRFQLNKFTKDIYDAVKKNGEEGAL